MLVHTSVYTTSASRTAATGSLPSSTAPPVSRARRSASSRKRASGSNPGGVAARRGGARGPRGAPGGAGPAPGRARAACPARPPLRELAKARERLEPGRRRRPQAPAAERGGEHERVKDVVPVADVRHRDAAQVG